MKTNPSCQTDEEKRDGDNSNFKNQRWNPKYNTHVPIIPIKVKDHNGCIWYVKMISIMDILEFKSVWKHYHFAVYTSGRLATLRTVAMTTGEAPPQSGPIIHPAIVTAGRKFCHNCTCSHIQSFVSYYKQTITSDDIV